MKIQNHSKHPKLGLKIAVLSISFFSIALPVYAGGLIDLANNVKDFLTTAISVVLIGVGIIFLFTRDWFKFISFIGIALLLAIFTDWDNVSSIAKSFYNDYLK